MAHLLGVKNRERLLHVSCRECLAAEVLFEASGVARRQFKVCLVLSVHASWHGGM